MSDAQPQTPMSDAEQEPPLTDAQQQTLDRLRSFLEEHEYQPSLRELADDLGLRSISSVHHRLSALEARGRIRRRRGRSRAIELVARHDGRDATG